MQMQRYLRYFIIAGILATAYMMILAWQKDYGGQTAQASNVASTNATSASTNANNTANTSNTASADIPATQNAQPVQAQSADIPQAPVANAVNSSTANANADIPPLAVSATSDIPASHTTDKVVNNPNLINVTTDKYFIQIDPLGGDIVHADLRDYKAKLNGEKSFTLLENGKLTYVAQSGLQGVNGIDTVKGRAKYTVAKKNFNMQGQKTLSVPLTFKTANGVTITKTYHFKAGEYPIEMTYNINNPTAQPWQGNLYVQLKRDGSGDPGQENRGFMSMATYLGGAWGTPDEPYNKIEFSNFADEDDKLSQKAKEAWVAMVQHYFVSAWIPNKNDGVNLFSYESKGNYFIGFNANTVNVAPNTQKNVSATLYVGPKIQSELKSLATGLNQTVDYGYMWPIAKILFVGLDKIHDAVGNWGWAIIILTILVKLAFLWISNKSYRSMGKMRVLAPKIQKMKDDFGDDRMRMSQEMMKLYKEENVNPMSGCLPLLIQMPIFIALYWVLVESVELRHAPWVGWIQDLSHMDPWFVLPIIMGVSMYVSQLLNPQPTDPMQAKVFRIMPILFTFFMLFFPAGLVLYWIVNNLFTVGQQTFINKQLEKEQLAKAGKS